MSSRLIEKIFAAKTPTTIWNGGSFNGADPNKGLGDIKNFIDDTVTVALNAAIVVALLMILYASFQYAMSYGDENKAETAKKTLIWSIVGLAVVAVARTAVSLLKKELS